MQRQASENMIDDILGRAAYLALCGWTGGVNYYVPSAPDSLQGRELAQAIGEAGARKLIDWAGGSVIYVPNRLAADLIVRQRDVFALRATGKTVQEIARAYRYEGRYTERQIWRFMALSRDDILREAAGAGRDNFDLF